MMIKTIFALLLVCGILTAVVMALKARPSR